MRFNIFKLGKNRRYNYTPRYFKGKDAGNPYDFDSKFSKFRDHALSADEDEMKSIVLNIRKIEKMIKEYSKHLSKDENNNKKIVRRHPFSKKKISKGEKINHSNIKFLRPEKPMEPIILEHIIGKKVKRNISAESIIKKRDLK